MGVGAIMSAASDSIEQAAERLHAQLAALSAGVEALEAERDRLRRELEEQRCLLSDSEQRVGALEAENAALRRSRDMLARRLDTVIASVEARLEEAG